jgi:hypothetical protein
MSISQSDNLVDMDDTPLTNIDHSSFEMSDHERRTSFIDVADRTLERKQGMIVYFILIFTYIMNSSN